MTREKTNHINIDFCHLFGVTFKNEKWPRNGSPGHGFECRPLNWLSFFAENPFPATPGPETPRKNPKFSNFSKIPKLITTCVEITMPGVPCFGGVHHGLRHAEVEAHDPDAHAIHHMVRGGAAHRLSSTVAIRLESFPRGSGGIIRQPPKGHREPRA